MGSITFTSYYYNFLFFNYHGAFMFTLKLLQSKHYLNILVCNLVFLSLL